MKDKYFALGKSFPIKDAVSKVTGELKYVSDIKMPNMLYVKLLLSPIAHGRILSIDTSEAEKIKGVYVIAHTFNVTDKKYNSSKRFYDHNVIEDEEIFPRVVKYIGDKVCAVCAESEKIASEAIKLIKVEYEEYKGVFSIDEALEENKKDSAKKIHGIGNTITPIESQAGDIEKGFSESDFIFEDTYYTPQIHHGAIETHTVIAHYSHNGKLTILTPSQNVFAFRVIISQIFNMPMSKVRIIRPNIGGAFGGKLEITIEPIVAILSKMTRRPVKLTLDRTETMITTKTRNGSKTIIKTGVTKDGAIIAQDIKLYTNTGAYTGSAVNVIAALSHKIYKVYKTLNMCFSGTAVYTNLPISGAMRGYGSPQIFFAQQAQLGKICRELNLDLVEVQKINAVEPSGVDQRFNSPLGNPRLLDAINEGAKLFNWDEEMKNNGKYSDGWITGIGMAIGAHGNGVFGAHRDYTSLILKLNEDGSLILITSVHDMGNGSTGMQMQIISEVLKIDFNKIETLETDTDACTWSLGDYASRSVFVSGGASKKVAESLKEKIINEASLAMKIDVSNLFIENEFVINKNNKENKMSYSDIAVHSQRESLREIVSTEEYASPGGVTSYGAHFSKVLVHKDTKEIKVIDYVAVHDIGKLINPMSARGQLMGGIQMGLGYALSEEMVYDDKGKLINNKLNKYKMITASEMPNCKTLFIEKGEPLGPYGAKSIGECATVPSAPAIVNAVANALNIEINSLPIKI